MKKIHLFIITTLVICLLASCSPKIPVVPVSGSWNGNIEDENITIESAYVVDGDKITLTNEKFESTKTNQTVFLVINGGELTLKDSQISKTDSDDTTQKSSQDVNTAISPQNNKTNDIKPNDEKADSDDEIKPNDEEAKNSTSNSKTDVQTMSDNKTSSDTLNTPDKSNTDITNHQEENKNSGSPAKSENKSQDSGKNKQKIHIKNNDTDKFSLYGLNSAIVCIGEDSTVTLENCEITTNAENANAVFATKNGTINVNKTNIITKQNGSKGLSATYGGTINSNDVTITTDGEYCACIGTNKGGGTITVNNARLKTHNIESPLIHSTGKITVSNSKGIAESSESISIEGKNSINLSKCDLSSNHDSYGILLYQSTSENNSNEEIKKSNYSKLNIDNSKITYTNKGSLYYVTNTNAKINSTDTTYINQENFINVSAGRWGKEKQNGGELLFNSTNEKINGNISTDNISKINIITKNSTIKGQTSGNIVQNKNEHPKEKHTKNK